MNLVEFNKRKKKIPEEPGVYFFLDQRKKILYIGKATSLRDRVRSYFASDLGTTRGPILVQMLEKAHSIDWRQTDSVLEALILEANLIRNYKPPHNTSQKDDKSWNHVVITDEDYPRVLLIRGRELAAQEDFADNYLKVFGPFPQGLQLRAALKIIRRIFPFRDTCVPAEEMIKVGKRPRSCFNRHLGLCPGVCTGEISKTDYRKIIRRIVLLFEGKKLQLLKTLERDMKQLANAERFEEAALLRRQVFALTHIQDISLIKEEYKAPKISLGVSERIEAYDVAHLQGSSNVGVMTVVEEGTAFKNEYRKFRIRMAKPGDDTGALREILFRRLAHDEWQLPRMIVVDGSTAQINAAEAVLKEHGMTIPVVGVIKDEKHRPREIRGDRALIAGRERDILLANSEAHRFAITYHRKRSRAERGI